VAVPVDGTGTESVAPAMAPPVPGVQKPPRQVGKWFWDRLEAPPEGKLEIPAGRPLTRGVGVGRCLHY
jgi:hypothetical protein